MLEAIGNTPIVKLRRLPSPGAAEREVVTVACDSGFKYLDGALYRPTKEASP